MIPMKRSFYAMAILGLVLAACGGAAPTTVADTQEEVVSTEEGLVTVEGEASETPQIITSAWISQFPPLPAAPQEVSIPTADGRALAGLYYPARVNPAPIIVLMHQAGGSKDDWRAIAPWLQNRADELGRHRGLAKLAYQNIPWLDPSWFPSILPQASFGVLAFDFGCDGPGPCPLETFDLESLSEIDLKDALAAVTFASTLEGVDSNQIITLGASVAADSSVQGCYLFNQRVAAGTTEGRCISAISLSPGDYILAELTYAEATVELAEAGNLVACLGAEEDEAGPVCEEVGGMTTLLVPPLAFLYSGVTHGMNLIDPTVTPMNPATGQNALEIILEILEQATGLPVATR